MNVPPFVGVFVGVFVVGFVVGFFVGVLVVGFGVGDGPWLGHVKSQFIAGFEQFPKTQK